MQPAMLKQPAMPLPLIWQVQPVPFLQVKTRRPLLLMLVRKRNKQPRLLRVQQTLQNQQLRAQHKMFQMLVPLHKLIPVMQTLLRLINRQFLRLRVLLQQPTLLQQLHQLPIHWPH